MRFCAEKLFFESAVTAKGHSANTLRWPNQSFVKRKNLAAHRNAMPQHNELTVAPNETHGFHYVGHAQKAARVSAQEERLRGLLLRGLGGDAAGYHAFLKDLGGHLRAFFRVRLSRLPDEVEDLVQESLLAVHNQRHTYDSAQPLTAWVHAIARYKMIDLLRRRAGRDALNDPLDDEIAVFAGSEVEAADARRDIGKLLERLPARQRLPIQHMKLEGLSVVEAAKLTGLSESAVKVGVHRGLKALAAMIRGNR
jgi:RNA polymerase sigma-70 factor (ECF subfamily)